jgi:hypothetical protein
VWLIVTRRHRHLACAALAVTIAAEVGRRRSGGSDRFPATSSLLAPLWLLERGVCTWCAVWCRLTGGVRYSSGKLIHAATPRRHGRAASP